MVTPSRMIMIRRREGIKNNKTKKNRIEQPYRHCLRIAHGSTIEFTFFTLSSKKHIESISPNSVNDPITALPLIGV